MKGVTTVSDNNLEQTHPRTAPALLSDAERAHRLKQPWQTDPRTGHSVLVCEDPPGVWWPPTSGDDLAVILSREDLVGRTVTCLLTNGIVLMHITVTAIELHYPGPVGPNGTPQGEAHVHYRLPHLGTDSEVPFGLIGHMHVHGTADEPQPRHEPAWYLHIGSAE